MKKTVKSGIIKKPENYRNWIIEIIDDTEDSGGFYLLQYPSDQKNGFDNWYLEEKQIYRQLDVDKITVIWDLK